MRGVEVSRFVINTHWQAHRYRETFPDGSWNGLPLHFSHEFPEVLETAGGLKHAEDLLPKDEPFWVYNGDILSTLPLEKAFQAHLSAGNEVTLVLRSKDGPLQVSFDEQAGRLTDLGARLHPDVAPKFLFTGIYMVDPAFLARIPRGVKTGVVPVFLDMIRGGAKLGGVVVDEGEWWDLGSRDQILAVHRSLAAGGAPWVSEDAVVDPAASILGASAVGSGARLGPGVVLEDSIVWSGAELSPGTRLTRCIVTGNAPVSGQHTDADL